MASAGMAAGDVIGGKYTVQAVLRQGSNATSCKALAPDGTAVAVEVMWLRGAGGGRQSELLQREAQTLKELAHPGIPRYLEYFTENTDAGYAFYLVQELVEGRSLADIAQDGVRCNEAEVERIARDVLGVLQYLALLRPPVVHGDVKPESIVLQGGRWGGRVHLVGFGGVQAMAAPVSREGSPPGLTAMGTYGYMAPEQCQGAAQSSLDVYALGGTLLFLLSGQPPSSFPRERMRVAWEGRVTAGPRLQHVLDGCLHPFAEDRFSAADALAALDGKFQLPHARSIFSAASAGCQCSLAARTPVRRVAKPRGARTVIDSTPARLEIYIPPAGLTGGVVFLGVVTLVFFSFAAYWTVSLAPYLGAMLVVLTWGPCWLAGAVLMCVALQVATMTVRLRIDRESFRFTKKVVMLEGKREGITSDLLGARILATGKNGTGRPTTIELMDGVDVIRLGEGIHTVEQEWVAGEINAWLAETCVTEVDVEALPVVVKLEEPKVSHWNNDQPLKDNARETDCLLTVRPSVDRQ